MRIFHILADNTTEQDQDNFLSLTDALAELEFKQYAVIKPDKKLETLLQEKNIDVVTQKFEGMFDLRTKKVIRDRIEKVAPHIVQGYGTDSLGFYTEVPDNIIFTPVLSLNKNLIPDYNKLVEKHPHSLFIGYDTAIENREKLHILPPLPRKEDRGNTSPLPKEQLSVPENSFLIGIIVPLTEDTDLDTVFQAVREIPSVYICIAGTGPHKKYFENLAVKKGIHDRTRFIEPEESLTGFLKIADLCIIPRQQNDTLRYVLLSWSQGTSVLSCAPYDETPIKHEVSGWIENSGDILKLRNAIKDLISNEALRKKLADEGLSVYTKDYSYHKVLGQYLNAYKDILAT